MQVQCASGFGDLPWHTMAHDLRQLPGQSQQRNQVDAGVLALSLQQVNGILVALVIASSRRQQRQWPILA